MKIPLYLMLVLSLSNTYAYQVEPMLQELDYIGRASHGSYVVTNEDDKDLTLEVSIFKVNFDNNGEEELVEADDDFLIFPPQTIIPANKSQTFRLRYIPNNSEGVSSAYRVIFDQLPIDIDQPEGGGSIVDFLITFSTIVIVNAPNTQGYADIYNGVNNDEYLAKVRNIGNGVMDLTNWVFEFEINDKKKSYQYFDLLNGIENRYLVPNASLIINNLKDIVPYTGEISFISLTGLVEK